MNSPVCALAASLLLGPVLGALTQAQDTRGPTGAIAGRVTLDGQPAQGVVVMATRSGSRVPLQREAPGLEAKTDGDGRYRLTELPAGQYEVRPTARALVALDARDSAGSTRKIAVNETQTVEDIDFALARGGVITGRVTDADGKPVIGEAIVLSRVRADNHREPIFWESLRAFQTDDRGVYRVYGLAAGRYVVSSGGGDAMGALASLTGRSNHARTYYPGVTDESKAKVVEVAAGSETTDIDISLGSPNRGFEVTGRLVDADTGQPVADAMVMLIPMKQDGDIPSSNGGFSFVDPKGEFKFSSILPGHYTASINFIKQSDYRSETINFEVKNESVGPLAVKLHRGAGISGVVVVEAGAEADLPAKLAGTAIKAEMHSSSDLSDSSGMLADMLGGRTGQVAADGSFRIEGLRSGTATLRLESLGGPQGLRVVRVERGGVPQIPGIEIQDGQTVADVRVIIAQGTGVIRGRVILEGGQFNAGASLRVYARRLENSLQADDEAAEVDSNGAFLIENLLPGNYELTLKGSVKRAAANDLQPIRWIKQTVTVTNGFSVDTAFTIQPSQQEKHR